MLHNPLRARKIEIEALPIRIAGTERASIVDGPGVRFAIFTQGCFHDCEGCHNPKTHDPDGGYLTDTAELWRLIDAEPLIDGVTFSGGEPFLWAGELAAIGRAAQQKKLTVVTYTGYTCEKLFEAAESDAAIRALLTVTDLLVDGPFILAERDITLRFRGSKNQRLLDITAYPNSREIKAASL